MRFRWLMAVVLCIGVWGFSVSGLVAAQPQQTCANFTQVVSDTFSEYGRAFHPLFTPDGKAVLFDARVKGSSEDNLYIAPLDGSAESILLSTIITSGNRLDSYALHPDGEHVIYLTRNGTAYEVVSVPLGGGDALSLGTAANHPENTLQFPPAWIADPSSPVVYVRAERDGKLGLDRVPLNGEPITRLFDLKINGYDVWDYSLSPDGQTFLLALADVDKNLYTLFTIPKKGGELHDLGVGVPALKLANFSRLIADAATMQSGVMGKLGNGAAAWTPDSQAVLFYGFYGKDNQVRLLKTNLADGTTSLFGLDMPLSSYILYTPDGRQVVMRVIEAAADGTAIPQLAVVPLDGGEARLLRQPDAVMQLTDKWTIGTIRISPDSQTVLWTARSLSKSIGVGQTLVMQNLNAATPPVAYSFTDMYELAFAADGHTLLLNVWVDDRLGLMALDLATGQTRLISGDLRGGMDNFVVPLPDASGAVFTSQSASLQNEVSFVSLTEDKQLLLSGMTESQGDTSSGTSVTRYGAVWEPVLSADGNTLIYTAKQGVKGTQGLYALRLSDCIGG